MAPSHSRQLLVWTLPTIAVLLSYLWYKKKRIGARSDPGDAERDARIRKEAEEADGKKEEDTVQVSPSKKFSRSLSGVDSDPIDIVIPPRLRGVKSNPIVVPDEDLDQYLERMKSMKYRGSYDSRKQIDVNGSNNFMSVVRTPVSSSPVSSSPENTCTPESSPAKRSVTPVLIGSPRNSVEKAMSPKMPQEIDQAVEEILPSPCPSPLKESPKREDTKLISEDNTEHEELQRQNNERDSANHSPIELPVEVMLASTSLGSISDNHSEGSSDSGKGGSEVHTPPPPRIPCAGESTIYYNFVIEQGLAGRLIGKRGCFVKKIKEETRATIVVGSSPTDSEPVVCTVKGTQKEINHALNMIRKRFPLKSYPKLTLEQVLPDWDPHFNSDHLFLKLIEGFNNETVVSHIVTPNHLFLHLQFHPTLPSLSYLTNCMNNWYSEKETPLLPTPIGDNTMCAAFSINTWQRALVLQTDVENEMCYVKFLDYGGYAVLPYSKLRQIRHDFMSLSFQAVECLLADIKPVGDDWVKEAHDLVSNLTKGVSIITHVVDYNENGIPLVNCYLLLSDRGVPPLLNQELVDHGFAEWTDGRTNEDTVDRSSAVSVA